MAFLEQTELITVSTAELITSLTQDDATIVPIIIAESISIMQGKLAKYYDIASIFATTGDARHKTILKWLKDIVVYEIYRRYSREQNLIVKQARDEAMEELDKLNTGTYYDKTLPPIVITDTTLTGTESDDIRFGCDIQYSSDY